MSASSSRGGSGRRVPELRLAYPLLEEALFLQGDDLKILLRLLALAAWKPTVTDDGVCLDAGEALISYRSPAIWDHLRLDSKRRRLKEAGRVSLMFRVLERLERGGFLVTRPARAIETPNGTGRGTRNETPPTIVRFLKYRDILWPRNADAKHRTEPEPEREPEHESETIPSEDPTTPADPRETGNSPRGATPANRPPRLVDVTGFLHRLAAAFLEVKGVHYEHADPAADAADSRAVVRLLRTSTSPERIVEVWRSSIQCDQWPRVSTIAELARHWAVVAPRAEAARCRAGAEPDRGAVPMPSGPEAGFLEQLGRELRPDLFERWFAPLHASTHGEELVLVAPDEFRRAFLNDNFLAFLERSWRSHLGLEASATERRVRLLCASPQATHA